MTDFGSIINGINQATQFVGAVNGAVNVLAPAAQQMNYAVNNMANAVNPYRYQDAYAPPPNYGYYPPNQGQMHPPGNGLSFSPPDESSIMGTVGNAVGGAVIGGWQGTKLSSIIKPPTDGVVAEGMKLSPKGKAIAMSGLKAGGIGAAIGGVFSGVENMMRLSKNEITGAEATGNIVADTTVGFFSGIGAVATGGVGALAMRAMGMGAGSLPLTIGAAALGLAGAIGTDMLMRGTGIRQSIADGIRKMIQ